MNIGDVAAATGLPAKTIRFYESEGLIDRPRRSAGNYRLYDERHVATLRFIQQARQLGFSVREVSALSRRGAASAGPPPMSGGWRPPICATSTLVSPN
jgi:DNA-binding transcriptional MerR regulator